jgi:hypothetical protein
MKSVLFKVISRAFAYRPTAVPKPGKRPKVGRMMSDEYKNSVRVQQAGF